MKIIYKYTVVLALGFMAFYLLNNSIKNLSNAKVNIKYDTIKEIVYDTLEIQSKAEIRYTTDTIIITRPFIATIDTITENRILRASYRYPENIFTVYDRKLDTVTSVQTTLETNLLGEEGQANGLSFLAGTGLGMAIAYLID